MRTTFKVLKNRVADINVNGEDYKKQVIEEIQRSKQITDEKKKCLLMTARVILPNSYLWKKEWDPFHIFEEGITK